MGDLRDIAQWFSHSSEEDMERFAKIAGAIGEAINVGGQLLNESKLPLALLAMGASGVGEYRKQKALLNPNVQRARNEYYGAR